MRFNYYKARPKNHPFPIVAWLIMIMQGMAPWKKQSSSHRALGYYCPKNKHRILDSTWATGFRDISFDEFSKQYKVVESSKIKTSTNKSEFYEWKNSINGLKYDHLQILGLAIKRLFGFVTLNSIGKNFKALTCNEVILHFCIYFNLTKVELGDPDNWDLVMTDELVDRIIKGSI